MYINKLHLLHFLTQIITWIEWKYMFLLAVNIVHIIHVYRLYWYRSKSPLTIKYTLLLYKYLRMPWSQWLIPGHCTRLSMLILFTYSTQNPGSILDIACTVDLLNLKTLDYYILIHARWMSPCYVKILTSIRLGKILKIL